LAGLDEDDPRRDDLEVQERRLLDGHWEKWAGPLKGLAQRWDFRRGFAERAAAAEAVWKAEGTPP
jgi:hypothetical protein